MSVQLLGKDFNTRKDFGIILEVVHVPYSEGFRYRKDVGTRKDFHTRNNFQCLYSEGVRAEWKDFGRVLGDMTRKDVGALPLARVVCLCVGGVGTFHKVRLR